MMSHTSPNNVGLRTLAPAAVLLVALLLLTVGCSMPFGGDRLDAPNVARAYPQELPIGDPLNVEIVREGNAIRLDNRTPRAYENVELWLNHEYGAPIDTLPVGRGRPIDIESFTNQFGESYPVAELLQPERNRKLVMADVVVNGEIRKLTVRLAPDWRRP